MFIWSLCPGGIPLKIEEEKLKNEREPIERTKRELVEKELLENVVLHPHSFDLVVYVMCF